MQNFIGIAIRDLFLLFFDVISPSFVKPCLEINRGLFFPSSSNRNTQF